MQDERGRRRIEQLRVVDAEDDGSPSGALAQRVSAPSHQLERVVGAHIGRHQPGERAERHGGGTPGRANAGDGCSIYLGLGQRDVGEARLPDTRHAAEHHAATLTPARRRAIVWSSGARPTRGQTSPSAMAGAAGVRSGTHGA